jgi:hypothetical protein
VNLGNSILKYDVNYDALKVSFNKNIKRSRTFDDIGYFDDMSTGKIIAKNCEIVLVFFGDIGKFGDMGIPLPCIILRNLSRLSNAQYKTKVMDYRPSEDRS